MGLVTGAEIADFLGLSTNEATNKADFLDECAATANAWLTDRCVAYTMPYPAQLVYAAKLTGARLYGRSNTPQGATVLGGTDSVVYVSGEDRTVESLLSRFLKLDGFA